MADFDSDLEKEVLGLQQELDATKDALALARAQRDRAWAVIDAIIKSVAGWDHGG